jgi:hypothetical protein
LLRKSVALRHSISVATISAEVHAMPGRARVRFKAGDIWDVPDDNLRYEVIDGDLFMAPAPGWSHQYALAELHVALHNWVRRYRLGHVVEAPSGVILDGETAVQPDLVYVSNNRAGIITERAVQGAPDLVVEVLSPSTEAATAASRCAATRLQASSTTGSSTCNAAP